jgi:hypothetical protein
MVRMMPMPFPLIEGYFRSFAVRRFFFLSGRTVFFSELSAKASASSVPSAGLVKLPLSFS